MTEIDIVKETQVMGIHRRKSSVSQVGRKCKLNPNGNLFDTHQAGKELRSLTTPGADAGAGGGLLYTPWRVCALVPPHWKMIWLYGSPSNSIPGRIP